MNILDYLATEFATFDEKPFNPIDSAILSQFCMVRAEGIVPALHERKSFSDIGTIVENLFSSRKSSAHFTDMMRAEFFGDMFTGLVPGLVKENMIALAASPRFRDVSIRHYLSLFDTDRQTQFAATSFVYKHDFAYVGFRGTDASFTGWRENFNMAYTSPVPAQEQALRYLEIAAPRLPRRLFVGGHSKGGNLATYAALSARPAIQDRIVRVYSHDGPGFKKGTFEEPDWARLDDRIHRTVPQDSIIGLLLNYETPSRVVKSTERGIMQHSIFSWEVGDDDFMYLDSLTEGAQFTDAILSAWLNEFSSDYAKIIVDALFDAIESSGAHDLAELLNSGPRALEILNEVTKKTDGVTRDVLSLAWKSLADVTARHIGRTVREKIGFIGK